MFALRTRLGSTLLGLAACQPSGAAPGDALSSVTERLQANETRLGAIEAKLDAIETKLDRAAGSLDAIAAEAAGRKARSESLDAMRPTRRRPGLDDGESPDLVDPFDTAPSSREIEGATGAIQCEGAETAKIECKIDRAFVDHVLADPSLLATQARIVPSIRDGESRGYKLYAIRRGSLPKLLGMKNGDMIIGVDGKPLGTLDEAMALFMGLRKTKRLVFDIERKGLSVVLDVEIIE